MNSKILIYSLIITFSFGAFTKATLAQNVEAIPDGPHTFAIAKKIPVIEKVPAESAATAPEGDAELIPALQGIIVEEIDNESVSGKNRASTMVLEIYIDEPLPDGAVTEALAAYLGEPLSLNQISQIRIALAAGWDAETGEVVRVAVPPQDITSGILTMQVVRARLGEISVSETHHFDSTIFTDNMRLTPGAPIDMNTLVADIDWLERNPYHDVGAILQPGDGFGETDILLNVQDQRPWQIFGGYDREGSELLGPDRWFFGGNHGNLFGKGHRISYQYFTDIEFENSHGHFASYLVPLPWRHEIQVSGFYSESSITTNSGLDVAGLETLTNEGESWQAALDYIIPLPRFGNGEQDLIFGFDAKFSDSNLDFGELSLFETATETYQFRGEWRISRYDRFGAMSARARVVASPGNWTGNNSDESYAASRAGADSSYVYGGLEFDRQTNIPGGFTLLTTAAYHNSSTNQLASEQLVLSGDGAVRGFERSRVRADQGLLLNAQLNAPAIATGKIFELPIFVKPFAFFDYGTGRSVDRLPDEPDDVHLSSSGLGLNAELGKNLSGKISYGWQLGESGFEDSEDGRFHIGVTTKW